MPALLLLVIKFKKKAKDLKKQFLQRYKYRTIPKDCSDYSFLLNLFSWPLKCATLGYGVFVSAVNSPLSAGNCMTISHLVSTATQ